MTTDEIRLKRFLHYGSVKGVYHPGSRLHESRYTEENVESLRTVLNSLSNESIFDIIKKVFNEGSSPHPEMIPFVLSECARISNLKLEALKTAEMLCNNTKLFLLFFKFGLERTPKIGSGPACKRLMSSYYLKKDVMNLASEVAQYPSYRGWRHKDLMCLGHIKAKPDDPARQAVFTYISRGARDMKKKFGGNEEAKELVEYLTTVDDFRRELDLPKVVETIDEYMLSLDHLNFVNRREKIVWLSLLRQAPLETIIKHFNYFGRKKMFRLEIGGSWDDEFKTAVCDAIQNSVGQKDSNVHPNRVQVEYMIYKHKALFKEAKSATHKVRVRAPKISDVLTASLLELMIKMYKQIKPIGLRFLIAVEPWELLTNKCSHMLYMPAAKVAACYIHYFSNVEPTVTYVQMSKEIIAHTVSLTTDLDVIADKFCSEMKRSLTADVFEWAGKNKMKFDCVLVLGCCLNASQYLEKFNKYQKTLKLNRAKLILHNVCSKKLAIDTKEALGIVGFDGNVIPIITSFINEDF